MLTGETCRTTCSVEVEEAVENTWLTRANSTVPAGVEGLTYTCEPTDTANSWRQMPAMPVRKSDGTTRQFSTNDVSLKLVDYDPRRLD